MLNLAQVVQFIQHAVDEFIKLKGHGKNEKPI